MKLVSIFFDLPIFYQASAVTCKQDGKTGGKKICKERTPTPCNAGTGNAFGDRTGGNCGGQNDGQRTDEGQNGDGQKDKPRVTKLNDELIGQFEGHVGGVGGLDRNSVPFSQQQTQMNMPEILSTTTTRRPTTR
jgi:hypothetical protein